MSLVETIVFGEKIKMDTKNEYTMLNSPIKWVGGKSRLRKPIIDLLPAHTCYVEVFGGAAWVLFGKPPSDVEVLNDKDSELINFFRIVREQPEKFLQSFDLELVSRAEFQRLATLNPQNLDEMQRAHRFYYLIMAGWGGELNYPRFQTSTNDGGHGNRLIGALETLRKRIEPIHNRLRTVIIENLAWNKCIDRYDTDNTIMYLDPPYPDNGVNYFYNMRDWADHRQLAERISRTKCKWILSSYDSDEVHQLFNGYYYTYVTSASGMKAKKNGKERVINREVLITNFEPPSSKGYETTIEIKQLRLF
ncbi:MAG: class adenine-specific methyltransferase [Candidatus Brocadiaceae bacterium]|nr:class adenine-specific methyltransferase [Candidatus Brocadiaceae bacterium]MBM2833057.1 class adenine-specific methyltransferase [Candidatus Brocadiaceae bacterium]